MELRVLDQRASCFCVQSAHASPEGLKETCPLEKRSGMIQCVSGMFFLHAYHGESSPWHAQSGACISHGMRLSWSFCWACLCTSLSGTLSMPMHRVFTCACWACKLCMQVEVTHLCPTHGTHTSLCYIYAQHMGLTQACAPFMPNTWDPSKPVFHFCLTHGTQASLCSKHV